VPLRRPLTPKILNRKRRDDHPLLQTPLIRKKKIVKDFVIKDMDMMDY
jgi:hypothetical protein